MRRPSWLNSTVFGIGCASLLSDLSHETVTSVLPTLLTSMGMAAAALGTIEGIADGLATAARLYGGWWTDRLQQRKLLCAAGYGSMAAATGLIAGASSWSMILAGRSLSWFARGLRTPPRKVLLAEAVTPATYGRAFGFERSMDTLGAVLAPLITLGFLQLGINYRQLIWIAVVPALLAVLAIIFLVKETPNRQPNPRSFLESLGGLPRNFQTFLWGVGLFGAGDFAHSLMILYAAKTLSSTMGTATGAVTSVGLYALHNIIYAGISYPTGILADQLNKRTLLVVGYGLGVLTALLLAFGGQSFPVLALIFMLGGAYVGMEETLEDSLAAELVPEPLRGTGFGVMAGVNGLGDVVSSLMVGWLWASFGSAVGFGWAAVMMAAGTYLVWRQGRTT